MHLCFAASDPASPNASPYEVGVSADGDAHPWPALAWQPEWSLPRTLWLAHVLSDQPRHGRGRRSVSCHPARPACQGHRRQHVLCLRLPTAASAYQHRPRAQGWRALCTQDDMHAPRTYKKVTAKQQLLQDSGSHLPGRDQKPLFPGATRFKCRHLTSNMQQRRVLGPFNHRHFFFKSRLGCRQ